MRAMLALVIFRFTSGALASLPGGVEMQVQQDELWYEQVSGGGGGGKTDLTVS